MLWYSGSVSPKSTYVCFPYRSVFYSKKRIISNQCCSWVLPLSCWHNGKVLQIIFSILNQLHLTLIRLSRKTAQKGHLTITINLGGWLSKMYWYCFLPLLRWQSFSPRKSLIIRSFQTFLKTFSVLSLIYSINLSFKTCDLLKEIEEWKCGVPSSYPHTGSLNYTESATCTNFLTSKTSSKTTISVFSRHISIVCLLQLKDVH